MAASLDYLPELSLIMAAYNEESTIKDAIDSIFQSDYPAGKIKVFVGSDGSTDHTNEILKSLKAKYPDLNYFEFERTGKNMLLNKIAKHIDSEIICFMDADCRVKSDTLRKVANLYNDKNIGSVSCSLSMITLEDYDNSGRLGESLYHKYERLIKIWESKINSTVNTLGLLSIRKEFFCEVPNDFVCDDLYILMLPLLEHKRVIYEDTAEVIEVREKSVNDEIKRRIRTVSGGISTVWELKRLLLPEYGWISIFLWSHKVFRYLSPFLMIFLLLSSSFLIFESIFWQILFVIQIVIYLSSFLGWVFEKIKIKIFPFRISLFLISMNIGFFLGIMSFLRRRQNARWERIDTVMNKQRDL